MKRDSVQALNLSERVACDLFQEEPVSNTQKAVNRRRKNWWIQKYFNDEKKRFDHNLRVWGIDPASIDGLMQLSRAYGLKASRVREIGPSKACGRSSQADKKTPVYAYGAIEKLCCNFFEYGEYRLSLSIDRAARKGLIIDQRAILFDFRRHLYQKLSDLVTPSLVLETNIARLQFSSQRGDPKKRFKSYVDSLSSNETQERFWAKYPVLFRLITIVTQNTTRACIETITRVSSNRIRLETCLGIERRLSLKSISWGSGDSHRKSQVVAILSFGAHNVVYKPRSIKIDKAYNQFIQWLKKTSPSFRLKAYATLDCGPYGYTEFIQAKKGASKTDIAIFYEKLGQLIGLSWLLGITDLHHENIIASGQDPYLVDLETMFDRPIRHHKKEWTFASLYQRASTDFMFRMGLLPARASGSHGIYDVSGIGAKGKQPAPMDSPTLENFGRDDVKIILKKGIMAQQLNAPTVDGYHYRPSHYIKEMMYGFETMFDIIQKNKPLLRNPNGPLKYFRKCHLRWVARDTMSYGKLLQKLAHPTLLSDALDSDMLMLGDLGSFIDFAPHLANLIKSEMADLWDRDVPYFWTTFETRHLFDSRGKKHQGFFSETCLDGFLSRLNKWESCKNIQLEAISLALKSTSTAEHQRVAARSPTCRKNRSVSADELINASVQIGYEIIRQQHSVKGLPFWKGLVALDDNNYSACVLPPTLYDGAPGIGLFLAYLFKQTGINDFKPTTLAIDRLIRFLLRSPTYPDTCGAFIGLSGLIYADLHFEKILTRPSSKESKYALKRLRRLIVEDENFDLISGTAGALLVLQGYYAQTKNVDVLHIAAAAAERLAQNAQPQETGVAWNTLRGLDKLHPLGGLSHGVSGIAWSLAEWAKHTGQDKWKNLACHAFAYEQTLFDKNRGTWLDARRNQTSYYWCHGAPGIALAVSHMRGFLDSAQYNHAIRSAVDATWKSGFSQNHCLCHGNIGNAEVFLSLGQHERSDAIIRAVLDDFKNKGCWSCGMPGGATTPGLMCGLAGIGYGLLHHAVPDKVPNLLNLEGPASDY